MQQLADFIARHVIAVLMLVTLAGLGLTATFWHVVHTHGERLWALALRAWEFWRGTGLEERINNVPLVGGLFARAMSVVRYLGLYAIVAFALAVVATGAFFEVADEIGMTESLAQFDVAFAEALGRYLPYDTLRTFSLVTMLGDRNVLIALVLVVTFVLLVVRQWVLAGAWFTAAATGGLLSMLLKELFARPRPTHNHGLVVETSFSFPSGHAFGSMLVYGLLGYLIVRQTPRPWHMPVTLSAVALIVFVGSSRVILQVHYFSDVVAGYIAAGAWVALCIAGLEAARWRERANARP